MYLVINKWVIAVNVSNFSGQYLRNHWTLDIDVLDYIGIVWPKEHSHEVWSVPPVTPCIQISPPTGFTIFLYSLFTVPISIGHISVTPWRWLEYMAETCSSCVLFIIRRHTDHMKIYCFFHIILVLLFFIVYFVCVCLISYIMYSYCYVCSVLGILFHCVVLCIVCVWMWTVLLWPGVKPNSSYEIYHVGNTRWFKYDRDWFVCKQAALRSSYATLREWSHNLHPPSCSG